MTGLSHPAQGARSWQCFSSAPLRARPRAGRRCQLAVVRLDDRVLPAGLAPQSTLSSFLASSMFDQAQGIIPSASSATVGMNLPTSIGTMGLAVNLLPVGATAGGLPAVRVYNAANRAIVADLTVFNNSFTGGVRVATGDVNGDGVPDVIVAAGPGGGPQVKVLDGAALLNGTVTQISGPLGSFFAYPANFTGGVNVAVGDINHDGFADIITGAGAGGGPMVKVYSGKTGNLIEQFFAYSPNFTGGVNVAVGDVTGSGTPEIVTGAGAGGGPDVRVFNAQTGAMVREFFAYAPTFSGGVYVAALGPSGFGETLIATGAGAGGGPHVELFNGNGTTAASFFAFNPTFTGGTPLGVAPTDVSGTASLLISPARGPARPPSRRRRSPTSATSMTPTARS